MTSRRASIAWKPLFWVLGVIILVAVGLVSAPFVRGSRLAPSPQPMRFSHKAHNTEAECEACHEHVTTLSSAGTTGLAGCMDCHDGIQSKSPEGKREELKLEPYAKAEKEIPWVRLPRLTPDVFFSHRQHAALSKIRCAACHGGIAHTDALPSEPAMRFTMRWCLTCHEKRKASLDCLDCHR
jgi:hypothetical protein